jgi:MscS family membrane protein
MRMLLVALLLLGAAPLHAQDTPTTTAPPTTTSTTIPDDSRGFETPRSAMRGYVVAGSENDWATAASYLDLRDRKPADGPRLARELRTVIDRKLAIDLDALSNDPVGDPNDGQTPRRDLAGTIDASTGPVKILLERVTTPEGPQWKIARTTVAAIPALWAAYGDGPLAEVLPDWFFDWRLFDVQLWQWIGLLGLIAVAILLSWLLTGLLARIARLVVRAFKAQAEEPIVEAIVGPLRLVLAMAIVSVGTPALWLALPVHEFVVSVEKAFTVVFITWVLIRLTDALARVMEQRWLARGQTAAISVVPLGRRTVKVFIGILALIATMQNFGLNVSGIIAGLGIGGLAVALAAQKTVENLFGGVSLVADQPVRVGDVCRFGDRTGTVEDIGLRSTRIRTPDRTVITIPNADFSAMQLENFASRDRFLLSTTVSLRYETTPEQMRWILVEVKRLLLAHPKIDPDPARIRLVGFGAQGLDLELWAYVRTTDANEFYAVREDVFLRLMDVVTASGTSFAFPPTRELDDERRQATEAEVARWRQDKKLFLVRIPPDEVAAVKGTLDWPPAGSPDPPPKPGQR